MLSSNSKMLTAKENYGTVDDLVQYISLHKPNHILLNGSILPFIFLYLIWLYVWIFIYGIENYNELLFISILVVAIIHIFVCLCCFWSVHIHTFLNCRKHKLPKNATIAKVCPTKNNGWPELLKIHATKLNDDDSALSSSPNSKEESVMYWFLFQKTKYIWNPEKNQFYALEFPIYKLYNDYRQWKGYQTEKEIQYETKYYGNNQMIMAVPEFLELFKERATAPFFIFQIFSVGLWCLDDYWYYSLFTLFMLVVFECTLVQQQLRNMAEIRKMGNKPYLINTYRFNKWRPIMTDALIPGDLISICRSQNEQLVPCDVLLLRGSCIVDESMLTGESVPQIKESLENSDEPKKQLDIESDGKLFCLFGGTKVVQHTAPNKSGIRGPDDGCVAYVLRNGFNTSQGKLLRTILFGVKRVTENNLETFIFILFLLIFAVAAASYVWIKGTEDPERNRYKLFLECTLILTSIIPPDLPIELTLAVNTSLLKLTKLYVYCTEPFRIPIAGKLQICCFDKTGTLTSDDLMVEGIAGLTDDHLHITNINEIPENTVQVLATCHTLVQLDDGLVGDPLEKATLLAIDWNLTKQDSVIPKRGKYKPLKIYHRFYFSSALKRMSVIAGHLMPFSNDVHYIGTVKGAPEVIINMLKTVPENYEKTYLEYARRGARVLALGMKDIGKCDAQTIRDFKREDIESDLIFVGFVIISCPLKPDSKSVIKEIIRASHKVVMITGDNPLTACFVAKELRFTRKTLILLTQKIKSIKHNDNNDDDTKNIPEWSWKSITDDINIDINEKDYKNIIKDYDLAITGEGLKFLNDYKHDYFLKIIPYISVYARFAPKQKELVITTLKALGYFTLMCGDGTNDVGALKHAHIGVSILSKPPSFTKRIDNGEGKTLRADGRNLTPSNQMHLKNRGGISERPANLPANVRHRHRDHNNAQTTPQDMLMKAMKDIEDDQMQIVKLGDASIAAPFTSKLSSIMCVCHIIKQGRCTLVTTLQMFKILALNALISAYCQSVLYVDGVKFSDTQATLQGLFIAACFLFITRSKPLKILSKEAPLPNIFNAYTFLTILLQFSVHFGSLIYLTNEAEARSPPREGKIKLNIDLLPDEKEEFVPNFVNSTIYIMCMALQVSTFIVNHKGHPFMESLRENRFLMYTIAITASVVGLLSFGISSELLTTFEIIEFPDDFKKILVTVLIGDIVLAYAVDRLCSFIFGSIRKNSDLVNN